MYTPVNPSFTIQKWGLRGSVLYRYVFVMCNPMHTHNMWSCRKKKKKKKILCIKVFINKEPWLTVVLLASINHEGFHEEILTLVMLNKDARSTSNFQPSDYLIQVVDTNLNCKKCRSRSVGFFRCQLIWMYTVCKDRVYQGVCVCVVCVRVYRCACVNTIKQYLKLQNHPILPLSLK